MILFRENDFRERKEGGSVRWQCRLQPSYFILATRIQKKIACTMRASRETSPPCLFRFPPSIAASTNPPICIVEWRHFSDSAHRSQKARDFANLSRRPLQVAFPIVQAVIHEPLDLHRSTIYCPLNLTRSSERISLVEKRNFESIEKKKENLLGEKRGSSIPLWMGNVVACYASESGPFIRPQNVGTPLVQPSPSRRPHPSPHLSPRERYCPVCLIFLRI